MFLSKISFLKRQLVCYLSTGESVWSLIISVAHRDPP